jgi:predicted transcriptional regulator
MKKIENIENYTIDIDSDGNHCLPKLELNNVKTLLVMKGDITLGTITDGDIRKALINNRLLSMPVKHLMNSDYHFGSNESECEEIFNKYPYIFMVPIVDDNRKLLKIFIRDI